MNLELHSAMLVHWIVSAALCIGGNGFTFYATLFYRSIGIDEHSVIFVRYLSIADGLYGLAEVLGIIGEKVSSWFMF